MSEVELIRLCDCPYLSWLTFPLPSLKDIMDFLQISRLSPVFTIDLSGKAMPPPPSPDTLLKDNYQHITKRDMSFWTRRFTRSSRSIQIVSLPHPFASAVMAMTKRSRDLFDMLQNPHIPLSIVAAIVHYLDMVYHCQRPKGVLVTDESNISFLRTTVLFCLSMTQTNVFCATLPRARDVPLFLPMDLYSYAIMNFYNGPSLTREPAITKALSYHPTDPYTASDTSTETQDCLASLELDLLPASFETIPRFKKSVIATRLRSFVPECASIRPSQPRSVDKPKRLNKKVLLAIQLLSRSGVKPSHIATNIETMYKVQVTGEEILNGLGLII